MWNMRKHACGSLCYVDCHMKVETRISYMDEPGCAEIPTRRAGCGCEHGGTGSGRHLFRQFFLKDVFSIPVRLHIKLGYRASNHSHTLNSTEFINPAVQERIGGAP